MHVCMYVTMYVCMYVGMSVCVCMCGFMRVWWGGGHGCGGGVCVVGGEGRRFPQRSAAPYEEREK